MRRCQPSWFRLRPMVRSTVGDLRTTAGAAGCLAVALAAGLSACGGGPTARVDQLLQRQEQMQLQIQQLERRLNRLSTPASTGGPGQPVAGAIKSITYRSGTSDDRLRIYWSDGRVSDLECTKEQNTTACG